MLIKRFKFRQQGAFDDIITLINMINTLPHIPDDLTFVFRLEKNKVIIDRIDGGYNYTLNINSRDDILLQELNELYDSLKEIYLQFANLYN